MLPVQGLRTFQAKGGARGGACWWTCWGTSLVSWGFSELQESLPDQDCRTCCNKKKARRKGQLDVTVALPFRNGKTPETETCLLGFRVQPLQQFSPGLVPVEVGKPTPASPPSMPAVSVCWQRLAHLLLQVHMDLCTVHTGQAAEVLPQHSFGECLRPLPRHPALPAQVPVCPGTIKLPLVATIKKFFFSSAPKYMRLWARKQTKMRHFKTQVLQYIQYITTD